MDNKCLWCTQFCTGDFCCDDCKVKYEKFCDDWNRRFGEWESVRRVREQMKEKKNNGKSN